MYLEPVLRQASVLLPSYSPCFCVHKEAAFQLHKRRINIGHEGARLGGTRLLDHYILDMLDLWPHLLSLTTAFA